MNPTFTQNWFPPHIISIWKRYVVPHIKTIPNARWLEVGSFEERSALWTLEHALQGPGSTITCVDIFKRGYNPTFDSNLAPYANRLVKLKGRSRDILPSLPQESFHGAYIDGSHEEPDVARDARETWRLLQPGAIMIFDDYGNPDYSGLRRTIDGFLENPTIHSKLLHKEWQIIVIKLP